MKLLFTVTDEKEMKVYKSYIEKVNQLMKNVKKSSVYTIKNGNCFAMREDREKDYLSTFMQPKILKKNILKVELDKNIVNMNGELTGSELFAFYKEHKKIISGVEFYSHHFKILTTEEDIFFESRMLTNSNYDLVKFKEYLKENKENKVKPEAITIKDDELSNLKTSKCAMIIKNKDIKLRINNAYVINNKLESLDIKAYQLNDDIIRIEQISHLDDLFSCKQFYKIINY